jgi:hypothetical protein
MTIGISTRSIYPTTNVVPLKRGQYSTEIARLTVNAGYYIITASSGVAYYQGNSRIADLIFGLSLTLGQTTLINYATLYPPQTTIMSNSGQSIAAITMGAVADRRSNILLLGTVNAPVQINFANPMITAIKVDELSFGSARSNVFQDWHPELIAKVLKTLRSKYKLDYPDKEA